MSACGTASSAENFDKSQVSLVQLDTIQEDVAQTFRSVCLKQSI